MFSSPIAYMPGGNPNRRTIMDNKTKDHYDVVMGSQDGTYNHSVNFLFERIPTQVNASVSFLLFPLCVYPRVEGI